MFCIFLSLFYLWVIRIVLFILKMLMLCNGYKININFILLWEGNLKFMFLKVFVIKFLGLFGCVLISYNFIF